MILVMYFSNLQLINKSFLGYLYNSNPYKYFAL